MAEAKRDRISELPEDLLVMILSFLPTRDAVVTMFLSKRWLFVWTMVDTLEYKDESKKKSVWRFLNKSLERHKSYVIDYLDIELGPQCPTDADIPKLIGNVSNRHLIDLSFDLQWSTDPIRLPISLYTCKTLCYLSLSNKILLDFPSSSSAFCLPSLVTLQLIYVVYKDEASLVRLLSRCPILEFLEVSRKNDDNVRKFSVKLPSLLSLHYSKSLPDEESDVVVEDNGRCLVIDTPSLEELRIHDDSGDTCSVENMPHLENASIDLAWSFPGIDKFIKSISSIVSSLELVLTNEVVKHCSTMKLSQLKELIVYPEESDWFKPLMLLLHNAPKLKTLTINYGYAYELENLSWNQPSIVPACLSSQFEIFNWIEYEDTREADKFLAYVFNNSKCLKTAKIYVKPIALECLDDEDLIDVEQELKDISRALSTSNLSVEIRKTA